MTAALQKQAETFPETQSRANRLVVLDFDPRWLQSTINVYGAIGPGWIMGPEYDYPVELQEYPGKFRIEKFAEEIASLGGTFFLKPGLDEAKGGNPLNWAQAGLAVPVASSPEELDEVTATLQAISLAARQSGFFAVGSLSGIRNPEANKINNVPRDATKAWSRPKWRGANRGGIMVQPNV